MILITLLQTSASLKFTVLNPKGRIWTMVAGGGASVIYADTVSLHPSEIWAMHLNLETMQSTAVLQTRKRFFSMPESFLMYEFPHPSCCATSDPDGRRRALLIGGGIANFTDVAATFNGIIRALKEKVS
ncbi:hypothetical protein B296_00032642 [Ensete ventricosum]|uniref:ATP-citrate synthase citrate-binding domain-containing protein n=1 Tax=Ensete ventricosum TaxID=4639 RepID=A0A426YMZ0_ENSVE|nr:hypothetical protein B296_00032642 [Ensete ventricosum]